MVQVKVTEGILEGKEVKNEYGGIFYSFLGVPYATPPLGDLRFKAPQPPQSWAGVRNAKEFGPICYQIDPVTKSAAGSEDCLYLNIYTPNVNANKPLPVMFYIHGGGFYSGSGNDDIYGPEFLVRQDVILVTINYRLEVLGFLCLDTADIPGNAGMKDQVQALRWVKKNISNFGGDPDNITIFGNSAGGASVSHHLVSPMTKGLFKRAISQSGTATCWWAMTFSPRETALAVSRKLGCKSNDDKEIYEFLKSQPVESLINVDVPITLAAKARNIQEVIFSIVSEKEFEGVERYFYGDIYDALRNGIHEGVDVMNGFVEHEGFMNIVLRSRGDFKGLVETLNIFLEELVPRPLTLNCSMNDQFAISREFKKFYFNDQNFSFNNLELLGNFYSFSTFIYDIVQWQKICARSNKNKLFFYKFTGKSERNVMAQVFGLQKVVEDKKVVCHADELAYLFPAKARTGKIDITPDTFKMIENVTKLWTNFAKFGDATPDNSLGVNWSPYTLDQENYLDIGENLVPGTKVNEEEVDFWEKIYEKYFPQRVHTNM